MSALPPSVDACSCHWQCGIRTRTSQNFESTLPPSVDACSCHRRVEAKRGQSRTQRCMPVKHFADALLRVGGGGDPVHSNGHSDIQATRRQINTRSNGWRWRGGVTMWEGVGVKLEACCASGSQSPRLETWVIAALPYVSMRVMAGPLISAMDCMNEFVFCFVFCTDRFYGRSSDFRNGLYG